MQQTPFPFDGYRMLTTTEACARIFTVGGRVHHIGEQLVQPDLARTLRRLAQEGPEDFYTGEIGRRVAADLEAHGAPLTAGDLAGAHVRVLEPLRGSYRGLTIAADPPPHVGPLLIELLNILEGYDLQALGQGTTAYYDLLARALYLVFRDRGRLVDPSFGESPVDQVISKEHAAELRKLLAGTPPGPMPPMPSLAGTTQVTTYDDEGSAVGFTHSNCFGSGVVTEGLGFLYNNGMSMFDPRPGRPNSIAPGKRPVTGGGPTMIFQGDRLHMVLGSPHGGRKTSSMGHAIVQMVDFGASPAAAVASARLHVENDPRDVMVDYFFPLDVRQELGRLGYQVREDMYGGRVCLVVIDPATGKASGASDPRGGGGLEEL